MLLSDRIFSFGIGRSSKNFTCNTEAVVQALWHRCLPVNFVKFPRTPFYIEYLWWLLLTMIRMDSVSRKNILKVVLSYQVKFYQRHHNFFGNLYKIMTSIEFFKVTCFSYVLYRYPYAKGFKNL